MKIDIDLSDIFTDEDAGDLDKSVKDLIIDAVVSKIFFKIEKEISQKVGNILETGIKAKLDTYLTELIPSLMDYEFQETACYGASTTKTTVKNRILKMLESQCTFSDRGYDSNTFTKALKTVVENQMKIYKPAFDKEVNALFVKEAMEYAQTKLKATLGIKESK